MFADAFNVIKDALGEALTSTLEAVLNATLFRLLYYIEIGLCKIVGILNELFEVFAGIDKVTYNNEKDYLINVFFSNRSISNVYWGMALIGIALAFGFTIFAIARKMFDSSGTVQQSLGQTITGLVRSIILIVGLSAIMVIVLNSTNVLMQQINYLFSNAENLDIPETIVYTDEQYAAMGRALNTIGNYSLVTSYASRYNLNTCYNEVRQDLLYLQEQGVFRYYYPETDENGKSIKSWQSVLQKVANSADLRYDIPLDTYDDTVSRALLDAMETLRRDASLKPLREFSRVVPSETRIPLDRYIFLMGTMRAAKNAKYNESPRMDDSVRGPYFAGEKSIYDLGDVDDDFKIGFPTDYIVVYVSCIALIWDLVVIILNCIARIFNMLFLYIIAPPIFAAQPLDNGGKTKQWMTAFIVQSFSVFGTVIAMRLLLIALPIIASSELVLFDNGIVNLIAKLVLVYGVFEVAKKATSLLTGILADSAGWQSVQAGDMSASAGKAIGSVAGTAMGVAKGAALRTAKIGGATLGFATKPLRNLGERAWDATGGRLGKAWRNLGKGDIVGKKAEESAKERLANEQAYAKLTGSSESSDGGKSGGLPPDGRRFVPPSDDESGGSLPGGKSGGLPPDGRRFVSPSNDESGGSLPGGKSGGLPPDGRKFAPPSDDRSGGSLPDGKSGSLPPEGKKFIPPSGSRTGSSSPNSQNGSLPATGKGTGIAGAGTGGAAKKPPDLSNRPTPERPSMSPPPRRSGVVVSPTGTAAGASSPAKSASSPPRSPVAPSGGTQGQTQKDTKK